MDYLFGFGKRRKSPARKSRKGTKSTKVHKKLEKKILDSLSLEKLKKIAKKHKVSCYKKGTRVCVKKSTLLKRLKKSRSINKILMSASRMKKSHKKSPVRRRRRNKFGYDDDDDEPPHYPENINRALARQHAIPPLIGRQRGGGNLPQIRAGAVGGVDQTPDNRPQSPPPFKFGMKHLKPNVPNFSTPLELSLGQTYDHQRKHYMDIPTSFISQNLQGTGAGSYKTRMQLASKNFKYTNGSLGRSSLPPYKNINSHFGRYFR